MRKSFGGSYGGGNNGGNMLRNAGRVARTRLNNFQESLPSSSSTIKKPSSSSPSTKNNQTSSNKHALSLSSSSSSSSSPNDNNNNNGVTVHMPPSWPANDGYFINEGDYNEAESEWEYFENYYDPIFGVVPSTREVQHALLSLQGALRPHPCSQSTTEEIPSEVDKDMDDQTKSDIGTLQRLSSKGSESSDSDWFEPSMHPYNQKVTQSPGWGRVHDAFHLLENEPSVQKMVVSLSSDKAVWDAVLNNEAVREIRDSYRNAAESSSPSSDEKLIPSEANLSILKWIFENMKIKLMEIIGSISEYVGNTFKSHDPDQGEQSHAFTEKLKSTFLLTVVVLLIVVVARGRMA